MNLLWMFFHSLLYSSFYHNLSGGLVDKGAEKRPAQGNKHIIASLSAEGDN